MIAISVFLHGFFWGAVLMGIVLHVGLRIIDYKEEKRKLKK